MKELSPNWLTEGLIDFEYKKYILLAYLQGVKKEFCDKKLYPVFSDLLFHYKNLITLRNNKTLLHENFPKEISHADFEKLNIIYRELINDDHLMSELEEIMEFAVPHFENYLTEGKNIYEEVENCISITPIGLFSLNHEYGFLFFYVPPASEAKVYEYEITIFQNADEKYRGIHTHYLETVSKSRFETFESIKLSFVKKYVKYSNPAAYLIDSKIDYPFCESVFPIAKRMLVRHIHSQSS
ncbi:MAG: hypothetical protein NZ529_00575 [Cytophagaceae bacterium]|nr:hypothetical protein [Cytophagaceae bacterium]MDW8455258.1 hypothetical protein [Cytophagaceae bacterium]